MESFEVLKMSERFFSNETGIEGFINKQTNSLVIDRLARIDQDPLTYVQLNQMLSISKIPSITDGFYKYYWLDIPEKHIYDVKKIDTFTKFSFEEGKITTLDHFFWGIERMFIDFLICFGNINLGYKATYNLNYDDIASTFSKMRFDTEAISKRGKPFDFETISKDDRYLISEMVCKTYDAANRDELLVALKDNYFEAIKMGIKHPKVKDLMGGRYTKEKNFEVEQLQLSFNDTLEMDVNNEGDIIKYCNDIAERFTIARKAASTNTSLYLSLVHDLDVYMATSMRKKDDFIKMATTTEKIFHDKRLDSLSLRYFDPTMSAADGHEDKGLIECLMVKCCKVLIYSAGEKESYGKDAEAAMALSLGKPVIFFCETDVKKKFYQDVHPLSRLINFETGVANGILVVDSTTMVSELLRRIFYNDMQYKLVQKKNGYYQIIDKLSESVVRIQTNNELISSSFWNYYKSKK